MDIWGPIKIPTYNKYTSYISFLDVSTRHLELYLIRSKGEALNKFLEYKNKAENNPNNTKIKEIFLNNAKEFIYNIKPYYNQYGIEFNTSPIYTPKPNRRIERINRTILEKARFLLFTAKLPKYL